MVQRRAARSGTDVEQNADVRVQGLPKGVEEPTMRVQLPLVLFLQTEDQLAGHDALLGALELEIRVERHLRRVLIHVGLYGLLVDEVLGDAVLVDTHGSQGIKRARMDRSASVRDDADDNLLPPLVAPGARAVARAKVRNVLHDGIHGPREVELVLVVHGDADEELRLAGRLADALAQLVPALDEVVGVAGDGGVAHVGELDLVAARQEAVEDRRDLALQDELSVDELDLLPRHLRGAHASALLVSIRGRSVVLDLFAEVGLGLILLAKGDLVLGQVRFSHGVALADVSLWAENVVRVVQRNRDCRIVCEGGRVAVSAGREQGRGRERTSRASAVS